MPSRAPEPRQARGDEAELFRTYNAELMRRVSRLVNTEAAVVEDACAFAWAQFMHHQPDRDRNWRGWMLSVAQREAWRLHRQRAPIARLAEAWELTPGVPEPRERLDRLEVRAELTEAVGVLASLPPRLREVAFLRALGLRYTEIADVTGDSLRRVDRLLRSASIRMDEQVARRQRDGREVPARLRRLEELERTPPPWLICRIGRPPNVLNPRFSRAGEALAWRRAALALDDYRRVHEPTLPDVPPEHTPVDEAAERNWTVVLAAIGRLERCRDRSRTLER
jgi:DNA-directed RNA polymerase specialized sigma24 family protein